MSVTPDQLSKNNTSKTFVTALVVNGSLLLVEVGAFLILKQKLGKIYSPRTYLPPPDKRATELPTGLWRWLPALLLSSAEDVIHKNGLDAYMFLRYIKMLIWIFLVFTITTFLTIVPVDTIGVESTNTGLDRLNWSNIVQPGDYKRFAAHIVVIYFLTFFVFWIIRREMLHFVHMRHNFLISKNHSRLAQARTVLLTSVPEELANEHDMRQFASFIPGGVDRIWFYRDSRKLNDMFEERQDTCVMLETAEATILRRATKAWRKKEKAHKKASKRQIDEEKSQDMVLLANPVTSEFLNELVPATKRPRHRTGFWGLWGRKVDTVDWCIEEIARLNESIEQERKKTSSEGKFLGSAFVLCNLQMGAHILAQVVSHHEPLMMYDKWMEAHPKDIVWRNLDDGALEMRSRYVISWLATLGLIIGWAFPTTFIGTLSNLDDLCDKVNWLSWVCTSPDPVPALVQGVLPPALLAGLFALLPFILRGLAWYECIPRYSLISVSVYRRFFLFLLVHGFLIVTLSSGITKAIQEIIEQPTQTVQKLAKQLPGASIFFLTYLTTQGLAAAGGALAQLVPIVIHFIRKWFLGRTPRQAYSVTFMMPAADFGIILPRLSLLATITFAYSVLSPLINVMALVSFCMFYLAFKFLCTQVYDQPAESETGGMYFPMAISNLFVGLYIEQICLACLFFLKISVDRTSSIIEGVFMLFLVAITASFQVYIKHSFDPITEYLPMSLATKGMAKRYEKRRQQKKAAKLDKSEDPDEDMDLFSRKHVGRLRRRMNAIPNKMDKAMDTLKVKFLPPPRKSDDQQSLKRMWRGNDAPEEYAMTEVGAVKEDRTQEHDERTGDDIAAEPQPLQDAADLSRVPTNASQASKASKKSTKSTSTRSVDSSRPNIVPPAAAGVDLSDDEGDDEADFDEHAFDHPSTYVEQPWIWVPQDTLGLSEMLVNDLKEAGIDASDIGASMDDKGVVEVSRNPPDEEWSGGHDV